MQSEDFPVEGLQCGQEDFRMKKEETQEYKWAIEF